MTFLLAPVLSTRHPRTHRTLRRPFLCSAPRRPPATPPAATRIPSVVIIGGGAAGYFAAIACARLAPRAANVQILEASRDVLSKVRVSGGGRCNVTSAIAQHDPRAFAANYPRGARAMVGVLNNFGAADVVQFFESLGVALKEEPGGKIFPVSDSSETVIDALKLTAQDAGVLLHTNTRVESVERPARGYYLIRTNRGRRFHADYVVVATGSARAAYDWVAAFGHEIVSPVPSLFTLKIRDNRLVGLAGVSVSDSKICLKLPKSKRRHEGLVQRGPLLITHWGLSGPAVLALSAFGARLLYEHKYSMDCVVDWVPALTFQEKLNVLLLARKTLPQKGVLTISPFRGGFPKRLWRSLMANSSLGLVDEQKWADVGNTALDKMAQVMHRTCFRVMGKGEFKDEFVTAGGVAVSGLNTTTFESKLVPNLYIAGEIIDVDGRTGGYNLQFAWASGWAAGSDCGRRVLQNATYSEYKTSTHT